MRVVINLEKLPPHNVEAEESVIGSLLIDGDCIVDLQNIVKSDDFFTQQNKWIYEACLEIYKRGEAINQITVAHELSSKGKLTEIGGASYLSQLIAQTPTSIDVESYANIVKHTSFCRRTIRFGTFTQALGFEESNPDKILSEVTKKVLDLQKDIAVPKLIIPNDLAIMAAERYGLLRLGKRRGIYTGFNELDRFTGGLFGSELCYIGARSKMGKSELLLSMARYAAKYHGNVFFVSLEMPWGDMTDRWVGSNLAISPRILRAGNYSDDRFDAIIGQMSEISESNLYFYDPKSQDSSGFSLSSIYAIANYMKTSHGLAAVFIDQLSHIKGEAKDSLYERTTKVSHNLKAMAVDLDVPIVCACQINRQTEQRTDKRPELSDLRDSGYLEADADSVWLLYRDDYYMSDDERSNDPSRVGTAELIIAAQRQGGEITGSVVRLLWDRKRRCYYDAVNTQVTPEVMR